MPQCFTCFAPGLFWRHHTELIHSLPYHADFFDLDITSFSLTPTTSPPIDLSTARALSGISGNGTTTLAVQGQLVDCGYGSTCQYNVTGGICFISRGGDPLNFNDKLKACQVGW